MLVSQVLRSQMQIFYREFSKALIDFMQNENVDIQLVLAHIHWQNLEELDIRTQKNISWTYSVALMINFQCICGIDY